MIVTAPGLTLDVHDFATLLGAPEPDVRAACAPLIERGDFRHAVLDGTARDAIVLRVLRTIESELPVSGPGRLPRWESGWRENLRAFEASAGDVATLVPAYYRRGVQVMRLRGHYVEPASEAFELDFLAVLRAWIGAAFFRDVAHVYEFGCGPCHNLVALARRHPNTAFHGLDWATASERIADAVRATLGIRVDARRFDMFAPDPDVRLEPDAAVLTMGALEQVGTAFEPFLEYLLAQSPRVCVHVEPVYELYDQATLLGYLGARYSERRGYLRGYLTRLRELERAGRLRLEHVEKNLGSLYHDGWTTVVWTPR